MELSECQSPGSALLSAAASSEHSSVAIDGIESSSTTQTRVTPVWRSSIRQCSRLVAHNVIGRPCSLVCRAQRAERLLSRSKWQLPRGAGWSKTCSTCATSQHTVLQQPHSMSESDTGGICPQELRDSLRSRCLLPSGMYFALINCRSKENIDGDGF